MPSRPDLRDIASNVKEAFADMDRDTLLDILTFVIKEYVVEGPPPMLIHQAETLADLGNASFAQLITAMQTRFDLPELQLFVVDGEQVGVRVGGTVQPLIARRQQPAGQVQMIDTRPAPTPPQPAVGVVETPLQQRPSPAGNAPPPARALSLRGRQTGEGGSEPAAPSAPAPATPTAGAAPAAAAPSDKPESPGDDASARFSLLELD